MTQPDVLEILKTGKNIFLTGPAGSGKTFVLNKYVTYLRENDITVAVTASTGIAATHLNGRTIHSWCGMRIEQDLDEKQIENLKDDENIFLRVTSAKVLIIDEISMLNAGRLDLVNNICQALRQDLRAFGGLQVILCGDFFQLPPVTSKKSDDGRFVVESEIWNNMDLQICYLEEQYRQDDTRFLSVLNDIRNNSVDESTVSIIEERLNQPINSPIKPTKLYALNKSVDAENLLELKKISSEERFYEMRSNGVPHLVKYLKDHCLAPDKLILKIGAVVMFVKNNFDKKYANGTLGRVVGFDNDSEYPIIQTFSGEQILATPELWGVEEGRSILASINQIPLRLAWAITIHKSQGMSLDCAEIDLSRSFEFGMGYVALSRVRSLAGIKLLGINEKALQVSKNVIVLDKKLFKRSQTDLKRFKELGARQIKKAQTDFIKNNEEIKSAANFLGLPF